MTLLCFSLLSTIINSFLYCACIVTGITCFQNWLLSSVINSLLNSFMVKPQTPFYMYIYTYVHVLVCILRLEGIFAY